MRGRGRDARRFVGEREHVCYVGKAHFCACSFVSCSAWSQAAVRYRDGGCRCGLCMWTQVPAKTFSGFFHYYGRSVGRYKKNGLI